MLALMLSAIALSTTYPVDLLECHFTVSHPSTETMPVQLSLSAFTTCLDLTHESRAQGVDRWFTRAMSYKEARWQYGRVGAAGEVGPLQIIPRYWCPKGTDCSLPADQVKYGVRALKTMLDRASRKLNKSQMHRRSSKFQEFQEFLAACHYKGGNECGSQATDSARLVQRRTLAFRRDWNVSQAKQNAL